ncbi:MAG: hypothetical protein EXR27_03390 [Betaproteobacteria bacterium]|nr:hypothetical protein [Betaproteobacteria bacterium]
MAAAATDPFVDELRTMVARRNANLHHPFARRVIECKATLDDLRVWVAQRYKGITSLGGISLVPLLGKAPDEASRKHLWEAIGEECGYSGEESHSGWLLRFAEALGMSTAQLMATKPLPEALAVRYFYLYKYSLGTFLETLAAQVCVESQNPIAFPHWVKALEGHYRIPRANLSWFIGHIEADSEDGGHAGEGWANLSRHANTDALRDQVRNAVSEALDIYWLSLDGVERATQR